MQSFHCERSGGGGGASSKELRGDKEIVHGSSVPRWSCSAVCFKGAEGQTAIIVIKAVSQDGDALRHALEEMKDDHEIVMKAVSQSGWALALASNEQRGDMSLIELALKTGKPYQSLIFLKVEMLSGRTYNQIFDIADGYENVGDRLPN